MPIIQITNTYKDDVFKIVQSCVPDSFSVRTLEENSESELLSHVSDAEYILASGRVKITRSVLEKAKCLKMIQRTGVGLDSLDLEAIRAAGIPLYVNKGVNAQSVAEHTLLLILACLRKLTWIDRNSKQGIWQKQKQGITTYELSGKTVGLIGLGNIGGRVAQLLAAFGAKVLYYRASGRNKQAEAELPIQYAELSELFSRSDIISLHCPLMAETFGIVGKDTIAQMKDGIIIVNTARGGLIDEAALVDAIESGKVSFAGLDVHQEEPFGKTNPLIQSERVIATPHIGGVTYDAFSRMMAAAMRNIALFEKGEINNIEEFRVI